MRTARYRSNIRVFNGFGNYKTTRFKNYYDGIYENFKKIMTEEQY